MNEFTYLELTATDHLIYFYTTKSAGFITLLVLGDCTLWTWDQCLLHIIKY